MSFFLSYWHYKDINKYKMASSTYDEDLYEVEYYSASIEESITKLTT
jgi:hypothetical protein